MSRSEHKLVSTGLHILERVKTRPSLVVSCSVLVLVLAVVAWSNRPSIAGRSAGHHSTPAEAGQAESQDRKPKVTLAAPGRVEGATEMINVSSGSDGVLSSVLVQEGQTVVAGQVVAVVACHDLEAELSAQRAVAESNRQARARLLRGSREEERREAAAATMRAQAVLAQARAQYQRNAQLVESGDVARQVYDEARRDLEVAEAGLRAALEREKLINAPALPEDVLRMNAEIQAAEGRMAAHRARLNKCQIKAPTSGTVVRLFMRAGESVSTVFPQPILGIVDTSSLKVRAEVDERDLWRLQPGQKTMVTTDAFPNREFPGSVVTIGSMMGRKKVKTGDPAEKSDRDVLEVMVDLDSASQPLVVGLRVTVQFLDR